MKGITVPRCIPFFIKAIVRRAFDLWQGVQNMNGQTWKPRRLTWASHLETVPENQKQPSKWPVTEDPTQGRHARTGWVHGESPGPGRLESGRVNTADSTLNRGASTGGSRRRLCTPASEPRLEACGLRGSLHVFELFNYNLVEYLQL